MKKTLRPVFSHATPAQVPPRMIKNRRINRQTISLTLPPPTFETKGDMLCCFFLVWRTWGAVSRVPERVCAKGKRRVGPWSPYRWVEKKTRGSLYLCFCYNVAMMTSFLLFRSYLVMNTILTLNFDLYNLNIRIIFLMRGLGNNMFKCLLREQNFDKNNSFAFFIFQIIHVKLF